MLAGGRRGFRHSHTTTHFARAQPRISTKLFMQSPHVRPLVDNLFRHESGKLVAVLTKLFGPHNLELAEDVVQDTLVKALEAWRINGVPENPSAWLFTVAKNNALDILRRERYKKAYALEFNALLTSSYSASSTVEMIMQTNTIDDELLRMMFVCCHEKIPEESQVALILKTLCGFSIAEIAKAFLTNEETITKRLYRARQQFRNEPVRFEVPPEKALATRLSNVHTAIYLLFSEGYNAAHADTLIRDDLVEEALRLGHLLAQHSSTKNPETYALLALMCFQASRVYGRIDAVGNLLLLRDQDRSQWNQSLIQKGKYFLNLASTGEQISCYHIEAAITFEHCRAKTYLETDWRKILQLYEWLNKIKPDAIVSLNLLIAYAEVHGIAAAIPQLEALSGNSILKNYHLLYATLADMYLRSGNISSARENLKKAIGATASPRERAFLMNRLNGIDEKLL
jgi:RNA polymerase sigma factor (sigma-70 family)